ncbi:MAG TPA: hypothetical protein VEI95_18595 [Acidobacteriota bacterium]|nr:hypothetical protein [Acidobacteriota bacterium]
MPTVSATPKSSSKEFSSAHLPEPITNAVRETAHQLMNQLTVIDLCVFQLRYTARPTSTTSLDALERAVDKAVKSAKLLSQQINRLHCCRSEDTRQPRTDRSDERGEFSAPSQHKTPAL